MAKETIGQRIYRLRKERSFTQSDVADEIHLPKSRISCYETGKYRIPGEIIVELSKLFEVTCDEILGADTAESRSKPINLKIARRMKEIENLSPKKQSAILQAIDMFLKGARTK